MSLPFKPYQYNIWKRPVGFMMLVLTSLVSGYLISGGIKIAVILFLLPFILVFFNRIFSNPRVGLFSAFTISFFALGIVRYVPGPLGLFVDGVLIISYLALFFKYFETKVDFTPAKNSLTILAIIWYGYTFLELLNPQAASRAAWFYAMRGVAFYMLLIVPIAFILFNKHRYLTIFLRLWAIFSILGTLKGMMQLYLGVDSFEQKWLDDGAAVTHILFGKLRIFSFYSDAGQFGGAQGHAGIVFIVIALSTKQTKWKILYWTASLMGIYGLLISGTRGAIAVPGAGAMLYIILIKNKRAMILGSLTMISIFVFFKYTMLLNGNAQIRRIRTGFDPNNPSLQVRLENQKKLKVYLANKPFGGGIGSSGNWGLRFSPNTFLANTATDSWYVMIWVEMGIVGLSLHLFILFFILAKASRVIMFRIKDDELKGQLTALASGTFGIMAGAYGNGILGQMPTGIIIYMGFAFMFMGERYDEEILQANKLKLGTNSIDIQTGNLSR